MQQTVSIIATFIDNMSAGMETAAKSAQKAFGNLSTTNASAASAMTSVWAATGGKVVSSLGKIIDQTKLASLFIGGAMVAAGEQMVGMAADAEQARISFENLLKSPQQAGDLLSWLTKYSLQTPVTRKQTEDLAQQFLAFGHNLDETKRAVTAVVEATSALGINGTRLNSVTYNLGQIFNSTKTSMRDFRDLQLQAIPVSKLLAEAVNDHQLKLSGYGAVATTAGGATKTLSKQYEAASGNVKIYTEQVKLAQMKLDDYNKSSKKSEAGVLSHNIALEEAQKRLNGVNTTIAAYSVAESKRGGAIAYSTTKLTDLTKEQEEAIIAQNKGKDIAAALETQLINTYGGSALKQVKTFSGLISNFGDVFQYVVQKAMGIGLDGQVKIGGAFDKMRSAASTLITFLLAHADDIANFFNKFLTSVPGLLTITGIFAGALIGAIVGVIGPIAILVGVFGGLGFIIGTIIQQWHQWYPLILAVGVAIAGIAVAIIASLIPAFMAWQAVAIPAAIATVVAMSPILLIAAAIAIAVGLLAFAYQTNFMDMHKTVEDFTNLFMTKSQLIEQAHKNMAVAAKDQWQAVNDLNDAIKGLHDAEYNLEGAQLRLEHAQRNLSSVTVQYGKDSLEARDARHELKGAEDGVHDALKATSGKLDEVDQKHDVLIKKSAVAVKSQDAITNANNIQRDSWADLTHKIGDALGKLGEWIAKAAKSGPITGTFMALSGHAHGGIVPGAYGQPVPIMAHGGERVVTAGSTDVNGGGGGGNTVNFYGNVTVDSDERVQQLAQEISRILGRQNELARYGAGF